MEILREWYDQISLFDRLKLRDAQALYKKAISTEDETLKKEYMDKIILGTLYVVYEYVKRNHLELLASSSYDISDIISSFNEVWIKKIYRGELLNVDKYSLLFTSTYFNEVYNNLGGDEISVKEIFGISADQFVNLLTKYMEYHNKSNMDFAEFTNDIIEEMDCNDIDLPLCTYYYAVRLIPLFEVIYDNLVFDEDEDISLGKTKIHNYLRLIIGKGLVEPISKEIPDRSNMEDKILRDMVLKQFIEDVDQVIEDDKKRQVLHERFGLDDDNPLNLGLVAKIHGITKARVQQIEAKTLRKLRRTKDIHRYESEIQ